MNFNQEDFSPATGSVIASEIRKQLQHEVRMEVEFCLSEEGLAEYSDFAELVQKSPTNSAPIETILTIPRLKDLGITRVDLLNAISESDIVEINGDGTGIRRKDIKPLKELTIDVSGEPSKKQKTEDGESKSDNRKSKKNQKQEEIEPKLFKITFEEPLKKLKDSKFRSEIEKHLGKEVLFARLYGNEGYFAIDASSITEDDKKKTAHMDIEIGGALAKVQECWNDDMDKFYKQNGRGLDRNLEKAGKRRKQKDTKDEVDLVFYCNNYQDIAPLEYIFKGILSKNIDGKQINPADEQMLMELLRYHDNEKLSKDVDHFEVGFHPEDESILTFFAVTAKGDKQPFSFIECTENLLDNFIDPKKELQAQ